MTLQERTYKSIDAIREKSDSAILFCSLGKDSLVLLDMLYPKFERIVCVFMYFVQHLEHIDRWIGWVKARYPKIEFVEVPHWNLTYILRSGLYCVPNSKVKLLKLADMVKAMQLKYGIRYAFLGMKKSDGMNRRLMLKGYEANGYENNGMCYPLSDWTQKDVLFPNRYVTRSKPVQASDLTSIVCFGWRRTIRRTCREFTKCFRFQSGYYGSIITNKTNRRKAELEAEIVEQENRRKRSMQE